MNCPNCQETGFPDQFALDVHRRYQHRREWNADVEALRDRIRREMGDATFPVTGMLRDLQPDDC